MESRLWSPDCGVLAVESWLWNPGCGILAVESWLGNPGCGILAVESWLWNPGKQSGSNLGAMWEVFGRNLGAIWDRSGAGGQGPLWEEICVKTIVFFYVCSCATDHFV